MPDGAVMRMKTFPGAADALRDIAEHTVEECCRGAAETAGVSASSVEAAAANAGVTSSEASSAEAAAKAKLT